MKKYRHMPSGLRKLRYFLVNTSISKFKKGALAIILAKINIDMCKQASFVATCPVKNFTGQVVIIFSGYTCHQKICENIIPELKIYQRRLFSNYLVLISNIQIFPMRMHIGVIFCHFLLLVLSITKARKTNIWTKKDVHSPAPCWASTLD